MRQRRRRKQKSKTSHPASPTCALTLQAEDEADSEQPDEEGGVAPLEEEGLAEENLQQALNKKEEKQVVAREQKILRAAFGTGSCLQENKKYPQNFRARARERVRSTVSRQHELLIKSRTAAEMMFGGYSAIERESWEEADDDVNMGDPPKQFLQVIRANVTVQLMNLRKGANTALATDFNSHMRDMEGRGYKLVPSSTPMGSPDRSGGVALASIRSTLPLRTMLLAVHAQPPFDAVADLQRHVDTFGAAGAAHAALDKTIRTRSRALVCNGGVGFLRLTLTAFVCPRNVGAPVCAQSPRRRRRQSHGAIMGAPALSACAIAGQVPIKGSH